MPMSHDEAKVDAFRGLVSAIRDLGNGNAATQMGAIENLAKEIREGFTLLAESIDGLARAVEERQPAPGGAGKE